MSVTDVDVVIIGAGISGLGAAYRITERNPGTSYVILERREQIGGTWDLFRYPGVRSDSSIFTLCFPWEPWTKEERVADGGDIRDYLTDHRAQVRHRRAHRVQHPRSLGGLGLLDRHLDRHRRPERHREDLPRPLRVLRVRLLQLRRGLHPRLPRLQRVRRHRRPSAALARGPRLPGQEDRGHRKRRDRHVADSVAGRKGHQGHHAAALPHLSVLGGQEQRVIEFRAKDSAAQAFSFVRATEQCVAGRHDLVSGPHDAGLRQVVDPPDRGALPARGLRRRHPFQAALQPVGSAVVPDPRRRPLRGDRRRSRRGGDRSHRPLRFHRNRFEVRRSTSTPT